MRKNLFIRKNSTFQEQVSNAIKSVDSKKDEAIESINSARDSALKNIGSGLDETLSVSGKGADAKAAGDKIEELKSDLNYYAPIQYKADVFGETSINGIPRKTWLSTYGEKVNASNRACCEPIELNQSMHSLIINGTYDYIIYGANLLNVELTTLTSGWTSSSITFDLTDVEYKYVFVVISKIGNVDFNVDEDLSDICTIKYYTESLKYISKYDLPYVTPQMFGAVADGETDDTFAIQSCISYASANRLSVFMYGHYIISGTVVVPTQLTIIGSGKKCLIENTDDDVFSFLIQGSNISISNFWLKCNKGIQISDADHRANDVQIEKLIIRTPETVFHIPNATGCVTIRDCYCFTKGTSGSAVIIGDGTLIDNIGVNYVYFYNSSFESMSKDQQSGAFDHGFDIFGGLYIYINNCDICGYRVGINMSTANQSISNIYINQTTFFQNRDALIFTPVQVFNVVFDVCTFVFRFATDRIGVIGGIDNLFFNQCLYNYGYEISTVILELRNTNNVVTDISGNFKTSAKKTLSYRSTTSNLRFEHNVTPFELASDTDYSTNVGNSGSLMPMIKPRVLFDDNTYTGDVTVSENANGTYSVSVAHDGIAHSGTIVY